MSMPLYCEKSFEVSEVDEARKLMFDAWEQAPPQANLAPEVDLVQRILFNTGHSPSILIPH
jgi:hypothetical protein